MAIYQDTYFEQVFQLTDTNGTALNINGWTWTAAVRQNVSDADPTLLTLTTGNSGIVTTDAGNGKLKYVMTQAQTKTLPLGTIHSDLIRTDGGVSGPTLYFSVTFKVKQPVTRL